MPLKLSHVPGLDPSNTPWAVAAPMLFCDGEDVPIYRALRDAYPTVLPERLRTGWTAFLRRDLEAATSVSSGHALPETRETTFEQSKSRVNACMKALAHFLQRQQNNVASAVEPPPGCTDLRVHELVRGILGKDALWRPIASEQVPVVVLRPKGERLSGSLVNMKVELLRNPTSNHADLAQLVSSLNAFVFFDDKWLDSFDAALGAAQSMVEQLQARSAGAPPVGQGLVITWHLLLHGYWEEFDDFKSVSTHAFSDTSASAAFALAVAKLLALAVAKLLAGHAIHGDQM